MEEFEIIDEGALLLSKAADDLVVDSGPSQHETVRECTARPSQHETVRECTARPRAETTLERVTQLKSADSRFRGWSTISSPELSALLPDILPQNICTALHGQSEVVIHANAQNFVRTDDLDEAFDIVVDKGCVVLCGLPGSGKTMLAHALLRRCCQEGFEPCIFSDMRAWESHVSQNRKTAVLMDGTLGEVRVDTEQYRRWRAMLGSIVPLTSQKICRLVVTVYPHVLKELREMDAKFSSPLMDQLLVVNVLKRELPKEVKQEMLRVHLDKLQLCSDKVKEVVESVLAQDASGYVFPWCCRYMVENWYTTTCPTDIFSSPAQAVVDLLSRMLRHGQHGESYVAVLALTMKGLGGFLHDAQRASPHLQELRLNSYSEDHLAEYADVLKGSILGSEDYGFLNRSMYDAVGLALGRSFRQPTLLAVCDLRFLVAFVRFFKQSGGYLWTQEPFVIHLNPTPSLQKTYMGQLYEGILKGNHSELVQHPDFGSEVFLGEFEAFCGRESKDLQQFVAAVDSQHKLPLVYWAVWNTSQRLMQWCFTQIYRPYFFKKIPPESVLASAFMCTIFIHPQETVRERAKALADELLKVLPKGRTEEDLQKDSTLVFIDFFVPDQLLTKDCQALSGRLWRSLENPALLPFAPDLRSQIKEGDNVVSVKLEVRAWWSLVQSASHLQVEEFSVSEFTRGASRSVSFRSGLLGAFSGGLVGLANTRVWTSTAESQPYYRPHDLHQAIKNGRLEDVMAYLKVSKVATLLDRLPNGSTPLHSAVSSGQHKIAEFLIREGAEVNANTLISNNMPLHDACTSGDVRMVRLLLDYQADINATGFGGLSPLHIACALGNLDVIKELISRGADVNARGEGKTALHIAAAHGHCDVISYLMCHGADLQAKNKNGLTAAGVAQKKRSSDVINLLSQLSQKMQDNSGVT